MRALTVDRLTVGRVSGADVVIDEVSLSIDEGEIVGVVGESAAGKSTLGLAVTGHLRDGMEVRGGEVHVDGVSILPVAPGASGRTRNRRIGFVSQHPGSALNPALRVHTMLSEMLVGLGVDRDGSGGADRIREVLGAVSLPDTSEFLRRYPHQLSGGQQQRLLMAIALVGDPAVLVLDEPTSGLDNATSSRVLTTIRGVSAEHGRAVMCISHDLAVVADVADRIVVLYAGHIVEEGPTQAVLADPAHPYTRHLIAAVPGPGARRSVALPGRSPSPSHRPNGCRFSDRCDLARDECHEAVPVLVDVGAGRRSRCIEPFATPHRLLSVSSPPAGRRRPDETTLTLRNVSATHGRVEVVHDVSLDVVRGEWLAIIGESGSGKTTLVRTIAGTHADRNGSVGFEGAMLATSVRKRRQSERDAIRLVPQHPDESFNPRRRIADAVARPLLVRGASRSTARRSVVEALGLVALGEEVAHRFPDELSGGELQRAAIARAIIGRPSLLLCDEITASLDAVIRAAIVDLLDRLRTELELTLVFVAHDPDLVRSVSDRTVVMSDGRIVEVGPTATVFGRPEHPSTQALLAPRRRAPD
jgi:peptide/nickel transport system ATP-binding protein